MPDSQQDLKCPACGSEMQKVFIPNKGINVDVCSQGCGGIYFDNKEIQEFSSAGYCSRILVNSPWNSYG